MSSAPKKPFDALVWLRQCVTACEDVGDVIGARRFKDCADEIERLRNERERVERDLIEMRIGNATPCEPCHGLGVRAYGSTATWRGGVGGQAITSDVCDRCWGSGNADRPWPSHRKLSREGNGNG